MSKIRAVVFALLMVVMPLLATTFVLATPSETAYACNPCDCPDDNRVNCQGIDEYGVYTRTTTSGSCYIDVYLIDGNGRSRRAFRATAAEIDAVPETPAQNTVIDQYFEVALYRLTSGEFQVNYGPSRQDGKVYELIWTGCPATEERRENTYIP
jgi:hypothetical protein